MRIVRLVRVCRAVAAVAVCASGLAVPARPGSALTLYGGVCQVAIPFGSSFTTGMSGSWTGSMGFSTNSCIYTVNLAASMTGSGSVGSTSPGPCGIGAYSGINYSITTNGVTFFGSLSVVHDGTTLTIEYIDNTKRMFIAGELRPSGLNSSGCPVGWQGVLEVVDPAVEDG